jgi:hypothetical protein
MHLDDCRLSGLAEYADQQQEKDEVTDIVIDEAPTPVEIEEAPSVNDRKSR